MYSLPLVCKKMRNKIIIIGLLLLGVHMLHAQTSQAPARYKFHSINTIGLLQGQSGADFQWQTINGIQNASWFAGVGAGIDYYKYRGIPLFIDLRKEFGSTANKVFIYGDVGIHFNWLTNAQKENNTYSFGYNFHKGLYTDAGIGYSIHTGKASAFLFSLGYSYKTLNQSGTDYRPVVYDGPPVIGNNRYSMGRITLKMGLQL